jgi:hypothetical protein
MKKTMKIIVTVSIFLMFQSKLLCIGIYGFGTISPILLNNQYVQNTGGGVGFEVFPNCYISIGIDNPILFHIAGNFTDPITNLSPKLFQNSYYLQTAYAFPINSKISVAPAVSAGYNNLFYRIVYPSAYPNAQIYPDFGSTNFYSLTPSINAYFDFYKWFRFTVGVGYNAPLNLNYQISNSNGSSLKNKDIQSFALIFALQLGGFD